MRGQARGSLTNRLALGQAEPGQKERRPRAALPGPDQERLEKMIAQAHHHMVFLKIKGGGASLLQVTTRLPEYLLL